jgi:hypothetical protein
MVLNGIRHHVFPIIIHNMPRQKNSKKSILGRFSLHSSPSICLWYSFQYGRRDIVIFLSNSYRLDKIMKIGLRQI